MRVAYSYVSHEQTGKRFSDRRVYMTIREIVTRRRWIFWKRTTREEFEVFLEPGESRWRWLYNGQGVPWGEQELFDGFLARAEAQEAYSAMLDAKIAEDDAAPAENRDNVVDLADRKRLVEHMAPDWRALYRALEKGKSK